MVVFPFGSTTKPSSINPLGPPNAVPVGALDRLVLIVRKHCLTKNRYFRAVSQQSLDWFKGHRTGNHHPWYLHVFTKII